MVSICIGMPTGGIVNENATVRPVIWIDGLQKLHWGCMAQIFEQ